MTVASAQRAGETKSHGFRRRFRDRVRRRDRDRDRIRDRGVHPWPWSDAGGRRRRGPTR